MQAVDIVVLCMIIVPALVGVIYGFLNIIFSIIAWVLALAIAMRFSGYFTPMVEQYVDIPLLTNGLAFGGLFIINLMLLSLLGYFIVKLLGRTGLTAADRILGLFLGIGLGGFIVAALVFLVGFTAVPKENWWNAAMLIKPFERVAVWGQQFLPENISQYHSYGTENSVIINQEQI